MILIKNNEGLTALMEVSTIKVVVLQLSATWCGPCKQMAKYLEELSADKSYDGIRFAKVDCDEVEGVAEAYNVKTYPTIVIIKDEKVIGRIRGTGYSELEEILEEYVGEAGKT